MAKTDREKVTEQLAEHAAGPQLVHVFQVGNENHLDLLNDLDLAGRHPDPGNFCVPAHDSVLAFDHVLARCNFPARNFGVEKYPGLN